MVCHGIEMYIFVAVWLHCSVSASDLEIKISFTRCYFPFCAPDYINYHNMTHMLLQTMQEDTMADFQ